MLIFLLLLNIVYEFNPSQVTRTECTYIQTKTSSIRADECDSRMLKPNHGTTWLIHVCTQMTVSITTYNYKHHSRSYY